MERPGLPRARALAALLGPLLALLALLAPSPAHANAAAMRELNLRFDPPIAGTAIAGAQLQACAGAACAAPRLLLTTGTCSGGACLSGAPIDGVIHCEGAACISWHPPFDQPELSAEAYPLARFVVQLGETARASAPFELHAGGYRRHFAAAVAGDTIALRPHASFPPLLSRLSISALGLLLFLAINLTVEPLTAWLYDRRRREALPFPMPWTLVPINLLSYPLIYGLFPALTPFANADDRLIAWASLGFVGGGAALVAGLSALPRLRAGQVVGISAALLPMLCCALVSQYRPLPDGVPALPHLGANSWLNLIGLELAVVLLEGWLLHRLQRGAISLRESLLIALIANTASFAAGVYLPAALTL